MKLESKQGVADSPSLDLSADFESALLEIDKSFNETMSELQRLHQKKIDLITLYKQTQEKEQLLKIRKEFKKTT
ncbi:MAG: hypothetical protein NT165_01745 [Candidatus Falkowbacteria bacterium]|nr:hypothetical protein [Candidatus Falkowbacteria bacterium]